MKHSIYAAIAALVIILSSCGTKHDVQQYVTDLVSFTKAAKAAVADGCLSETEIDQLYALQMAIINTQNKYSSPEAKEEFDEQLRHFISPDIRQEYAATMLSVAFCAGADKLSERIDRE